jgi:nicotinamide mononucleotide transporter
MSLTINASALWEFFAVALGLVYVTLAARHNPWAWVAAFVSTAIYAVIFWLDALPMQASLNLYYMFIAIYGWHQWRQKKGEAAPIIHRMSLREHSLFISFGLVATLVVGYLLSSFDLSQAPYLDTATTLFAMANTWLLLTNRLENWLYWIAIDSVNILLFTLTEHYSTVLLFATYIVLSVYGYLNWRKQLT